MILYKIIIGYYTVFSVGIKYSIKIRGISDEKKADIGFIDNVDGGNVIDDDAALFGLC